MYAGKLAWIADAVSFLPFCVVVFSAVACSGAASRRQLIRADIVQRNTDGPQSTVCTQKAAARASNRHTVMLQIVGDHYEFRGRGNEATGDPFLAAPNLDHTADFVKHDLCEWLCWMRSEFGFDGWRCVCRHSIRNATSAADCRLCWSIVLCVHAEHQLFSNTNCTATVQGHCLLRASVMPCGPPLVQVRLCARLQRRPRGGLLRGDGPGVCRRRVLGQPRVPPRRSAPQPGALSRCWQSTVGLAALDCTRDGIQAHTGAVVDMPLLLSQIAQMQLSSAAPSVRACLRRSGGMQPPN